MAKKKQRVSPRGRRVFDIDIEIGRRVRAQRLLRKLTQTELADAIGITFQQVQKYENGTNRISAGKLFEIAHFLKIPVAMFFENVNTEAFSKSEQSDQAEYRALVAFAKSPIGQKIYRAFASIADRKKQRILIQMIETMSASD